MVIELVGRSRGKVLVKVDGNPVPMTALSTPTWVDPGQHEVVAEIAGRWAVRRRVTLPEGGATHTVRLLLPEAPAEPSPSGASEEGLSGWEIAALVGLGLGGASLTASLPLGLLALDDDDLQGAALGTLLGGGLLVIGCGSWFMGLEARGGPAPSGPGPAPSLVSIEPMAGPGGIGIAGRF
jgi:hypothetical protein